MFLSFFLYLCRWNCSQLEWVLRHPYYRCRSGYDQWSFYQKAWCGHNRKPTGGVLFANSLMYGNSIFRWTSTYKALLFPVSWPSFSWCITFGISSFWLCFSFSLVVRRSAILLKIVWSFAFLTSMTRKKVFAVVGCSQKVSLIDKFSFSSFDFGGC